MALGKESVTRAASAVKNTAAKPKVKDEEVLTAEVKPIVKKTSARKPKATVAAAEKACADATCKKATCEGCVRVSSGERMICDLPIYLL